MERDAIASELIDRVPALAGDSERVRVALTALLDESMSAWPSWIDAPRFVAHIAALITKTDQPLQALEALHRTDVYLAAAVVGGSAPACAALEEQIRRIAKKVVLRMNGDQAEAEETASEVIEKLLVGTNERDPRIGDYQGRGSLGGWLRATVSRTYLNRKRKHKREVLVGDNAVLEALDDDHSDPAMVHVKSQYRAEFAAAFETAIASLTDRQRGVLRYRFVDGATVETIAAVYKIHRATCHRWIADARMALAAATEQHLRTRLASSDEDLEAIRALIESQLELSLSRMFGS